MMVFNICPLVLICLSLYGRPASSDDKVYEVDIKNTKMFFEMDFLIKYKMSGKEGQFTPADIYRFKYWPNNNALFLEIKDAFYGEHAQIQCRIKDSETEFEFVKCEMTIIPDLHAKMLTVRFGHFFKFNKDTKYEYSGKAMFSFSNIADNRHYTLEVFKLKINFQNPTQTCELNDNNLNTMFVDIFSKEYVYPCNTLENKPTPIAYSNYFGTCCCILNDDREKWTVKGEPQCEYIYYAHGCVDKDAHQCLKTLPGDVLKYSLCRTCAREF